MVGGLTAHDAGAHRVAHAPLLRGLGVDGPHFGVVGQAEVVVDAPDQDLLSPKGHAVGDVSLELGEGEVSVGLFSVRPRGPRLLRMRSKMSKT